MDTKHIGTIGELAVALKLQRLGWEVFSELGDNSKIDLIAHKDGKLLKIQVKTVEETERTNSMLLRKSKITNGKRVEYSKRDVDIFAVFVLDRNKVAFVPFKTFGSKKSICIRFEKSRSGRKSLMFDQFVLPS